MCGRSLTSLTFRLLDQYLFGLRPKEGAQPQIENQSLPVGQSRHRTSGGEAEINLVWRSVSRQKLNRPPILPLWKDRWPVTGNLSSSAKSSTRDSPSPHRPSQRRADRNNNSDGCSVYSSMFSNTGAYENHDQTTRAKPLRQAEVGFELGYSHHMNQHNCEPNHEDCLRNRA